MVGSTISHYKILEELGRGGMGIVYKAKDTKLDRTVAIKVLPFAALASKDDRARFYREAKAAAQLHHPHIARVFEIDEAIPEGSKDDDLRPFIAMEYIEGKTLDAKIKESHGKWALLSTILDSSIVSVHNSVELSVRNIESISSFQMLAEATR